MRPDFLECCPQRVIRKIFGLIAVERDRYRDALDEVGHVNAKKLPPKPRP